MKLLHITATHLKPDGGVPVVLKNLVNEQNSIKDFQAKVISVVAPVDEMNSPYFEFVPKREFVSFIKKYNPDFVILHSFYYMDYNWVVDVLSEHNIRYFIEPHGSFGNAAMKKSWIKKKIANHTIFKKQIKNAFGYIFLNSTEKEDSVYRTQNDLVIPNGINSLEINHSEINKQNGNVYFIGRYDIIHKGLDYLFDALDILDSEKLSFSFHFWGKGDSDAEGYVKKRISSYRYITVRINSSIYAKEKDKMLEQFGPMILTSRYEGFPMTILEAWMYGNPCIVTPGTNVADEIKSNNLGWVTSLDAQEIAKTIKVAVSEYDLNRKYYINHCKEYICDNYDWKVLAQISYAHLKQLL